ncbi:MAG: efflux RND transporter permease subunit [Acidobacteriota bacterium]|nr:efflux RND transporter permease subunit [Acidobacteriota bacterium]
MQWLAEICVKRPVFATMLILSLVVLGGFSFFSLGVDLFPKIDLPTVVITTINPGASPTEVETEVSDKIEASVNTVSGIDELRSTSVEGVSTVIATFSLDKNGDVAAQEVRDKINLIIGNLPDTIEQPVIQKIDPDASPILRIVVSGPLPLREVTEIADKQVVKRIETINGVGQVNMVGGGTREIQVLLDPEKMQAYGVTFTDVSNAVRQQNLEVPGGRINQGGTELTLRTLGRITDPEQFNEIVVATRGGFAVKIRDIGKVADTIEEPRTAARLNGQPAVTLIVQKQSGQNTVAVADAIKQRLAEIQPTLPKGFRTQVIGDQSIFIKASLDAIEEHLLLGGLLAAIVVFVFLWNFRATVIAALAIPTSIIATFAVMYAMDYTLNQITMLALTLMVGIVIDDAIVVLENIFRFIEEKGMSPYQAAIEGTREIGLAVLATTFSLLAVFVPVGFMGGIIGRFMSSFGLTAAAAIAVSLLVSFTLTPMLAARLIKRQDPKDAAGSEEARESAVLNADVPADSVEAEHHAHESKESGWYSYIDRSYTWLLKLSMAHRWAIVALCVLVVVSIVPLFMLVGKNFLPVDDQSQFEISVRTKEGSTLPATTTIVERIAADVRRLPGVTDTLATIGGGQQQTVNTGSVYVKLADIDERAQSQDELMIRARELLKNYPPEFRTSVQAVAAISGGGQRNAPVQFFLSGPDLEKLSRYSAALLEKMKAIPDVVDADTSLVVGKPELRAEVDRARAADLGVRVGDVAQALNALVAGQEISTFNVGTDQYNVRLRALGQYRTTAEGLRQISVASSKGGTVTLDKVVKFTPGSGPSAIDRLNRQRQVTLSSNIRPGGSQSVVIDRMNTAVAELNLEPGYTSGVAGQSKELAKSAYYFLLAIVMSFIFMYIVLAAQFESFIHPVTILLTLPLSIPFGILSLLVMGQTVNIFSALGLLLLFGVVKKNAILQIDHTNGLRAAGMARYDAIIQANRDRLRPILMTTIALVAGMLPLVVSTGPGSGTNRSIGVLVVGGQSLCLLLTLLAVPVFYSLFEDLGESRAWGYIGGAYTKVTGGVGQRISGAWTNARASFSRKNKKEKYAESTQGE